MGLVKGKNVKSVRTLKTMYDGDSVEVLIGDNWYRLKAGVIAQMAKDYNFVPEKKKIHTYLTIANAQLAAVAPDMLNCLKAVLSNEDRPTGNDYLVGQNTMEKIRQIIAKAEGGE